MSVSSPAAVAEKTVQSAARPQWSVEAVLTLFEMPLMDLIWRAQEVHRRHFDPNAIQRSALFSVKTGGCPENCTYCSQSAHYKTETERDRLKPVKEVITAALAAKDAGASRFCMGAAWRGPRDLDLEYVMDMVREVKALGMETCVTLGMLKEGQAEKLKAAGLDYYNHNLDTDAEFYGNIVTTHTHADRLDTLARVREAGLKVCCGGILGMGESRRHRAGLISQLASLPVPPQSVPINNLVPIPGTPLAEQPRLDPFEIVRTIAAARITMPTSWVRLSAGRAEMSDELQVLCFLAGANSMFYGDRLLTTDNADFAHDQALFERLGLKGV